MVTRHLSHFVVCFLNLVVLKLFMIVSSETFDFQILVYSSQYHVVKLEESILAPRVQCLPGVHRSNTGRYDLFVYTWQITNWVCSICQLWRRNLRFKSLKSNVLWCDCISHDSISAESIETQMLIHTFQYQQLVTRKLPFEFWQIWIDSEYFQCLSYTTSS